MKNKNKHMKNKYLIKSIKSFGYLVKSYFFSNKKEFVPMPAYWAIVPSSLEQAMRRKN